MQESSTYQAILQEGEAMGEAKGVAKGRVEGEAKGEAIGRVEGERRVLLRLGAKRFGEPDVLTLEAIQAIPTTEQLDLLSDRLLEVETWAELME
jgi:predicted transposase YdaD